MDVLRHWIITLNEAGHEASYWLWRHLTRICVIMSSLVMPHAKHIPVESQWNIFFTDYGIEFQVIFSSMCPVQSLSYNIYFNICSLAHNGEEILALGEDAINFKT
jgi:hypothetical protein